MATDALSPILGKILKNIYIYVHGFEKKYLSALRCVRIASCYYPSNDVMTTEKLYALLYQASTITVGGRKRIPFFPKEIFFFVFVYFILYQPAHLSV